MTDELTTIAGRIYAELLGVKASMVGMYSGASDEQLAKNALAAADTFLKARDKMMGKPSSVERPDSDVTRAKQWSLDRLNGKADTVQIEREDK